MAENKKTSSSYLVVAGKTVNVTYERVPIDSVSLDPSNPRIRFALRQAGKGDKCTQAELMSFIRTQPGYDNLHKTIRKAGGIHEPIIVRHDGSIVEGNSRATTLKALRDGNPGDERWQTIPIMRLENGVPENATAMLMAAYHVAGKTAWRAYAQADQIHYLVETLKWPVDRVADETRMSSKEVEQYIAAYKYLIDEVLPHAGKGGQKLLESKWSHALEFVKSKNLARLREDPQVRKDVAKLLVQGKIKGAEVRELHKVLGHKKAKTALKKDGFKAAKDVLKRDDPTVDSSVLRQMQKLTTSLNGLQSDEWDQFKAKGKARDILIAHAKAIRDLMAVIGIKSVAKNE